MPRIMELEGYILRSGIRFCRRWTSSPRQADNPERQLRIFGYAERNWMGQRILLLDDSCDLELLFQRNLTYFHTIICLFWASPGMLRRLSDRSSAVCLSLMDVIGSVDRWEREAGNLVHEFCGRGQTYRGVPWRRFLTEPLYRECLSLQVAISTVSHIEGLRQRFPKTEVTVDYIVSSSFRNFLIAAISSLQSGVIYQPYPDRSQPISLKPSPFSLVKRLGSRFREVRLTGGWKTHVWDLLLELDKSYRVRRFWHNIKRPPQIAREGITFFSSYLNNSRILDAFVSLMPAPINWVLTNDSARAGASSSVDDKFWLWQFSPSKDEASGWRVQDCHSTMDLNLSKEAILENWLTHSRVWRDWQNGHLSNLSALTHYWETYLKQARPRLAVMANQWGIEGWLILIAKSYGIPVMQIMHGVLGGHLYTQTPILADIQVVPGEFWRNLWPEDQRRKIIVYNPTGHIAKIQRHASFKKKRLTYFSWPLMLSPFYNFCDLTDGLIGIFEKLLSRGGCEITVRVHSTENPYDFVRRWRHLCGALPEGLHISKHEPLAEILAKTDVALMYRSTVMLNCLISDIPVIMPGWIDFGWNKALVGVPRVYLACDFADLEQRLTNWLEDPPKVSTDVAEYFVRSPGEDRSSFLSLINELVSSGQTSC